MVLARDVTVGLVWAGRGTVNSWQILLSSANHDLVCQRAPSVRR